MQSGFEPGIFRSRGGRLNYYANKAVPHQSINSYHSYSTTDAVTVIAGGAGVYSYENVTEILWHNHLHFFFC